MILVFAKGSRKTVIIGLEPAEARSILRGGNVETGNEEMRVLVGRAAEIVAELHDAGKSSETRVDWEIRPCHRA